MDQPVTVSTFYSFTTVENPAALKPALLARMKEMQVRGTITLAHEGINATISGAAESISVLMDFLREQIPFATPTFRESHFSQQPFKRSKVKVKKELISLGAEANPAVCAGQYVMPGDWNALITSPDVIVVDTRNDYEFAMGHFEGAVNPGTRNFKHMVAFTERHLDPAAGKKIAMYCTGGIRCEKYSAYLMTRGFPQVFHLHGGILAYLEQIPEQMSLWRGRCFVFDEREAVGHGLTVATT